MIASLLIAPPPGQFPRRQLPPHHNISPENNCPHSSKFSQKMLRMNWGELCIGYEYYNEKIILPKVIFQGCKTKNGFFIYF